MTTQDSVDLNAPDPGIPRAVLAYGAWMLATLAAFSVPLWSVVRFAVENDDASHVVVIPFMAAVLIYLQHERIFARLSRELVISTSLIVLAAVLTAATVFLHRAWDNSTTLAAYMLSVVMLWVAGFALFFGKDAFRLARFPLLFLLLAVPLPKFFLAHVVHALQVGSAGMVGAIFNLTGTPFLRDGFVFQMGRFNIEIAEECSGIRSSMAVLILALLAAHFYLRTFWKQVVFIVCSLLIMIVKNGVRIATLTLLSLHVNPGFLFGRLHRDGGVVFFLLGMVSLFPVLWALQRGENLLVISDANIFSPKRVGKPG